MRANENKMDVQRFRPSRASLVLVCLVMWSVAMAASPDQTVVKIGDPSVLTDATGNRWSITSASLVAVNGLADKTTARVIEIAYVGGKIWQENQDLNWWSKTSPFAQWVGGSSVSPLSGTPPPTATTPNAPTQITGVFR